MTKTEEIENLKQEISGHEAIIADYCRMAKDGIWINHNENSHYIELQNTTNKLMDKTDKLQEINTELISAIANLNGGVLKDLSQTIVNLTGK